MAQTDAGNGGGWLEEGGCLVGGRCSSDSGPFQNPSSSFTPPGRSCALRRGHPTSPGPVSPSCLSTMCQH